MSTRWLPKHHYPRAELHSLGPSCDETHETGLGLKLADGSILRVRLSAEHANWIQAGLEEDYARRNGVVDASDAATQPAPGTDLVAAVNALTAELRRLGRRRNAYVAPFEISPTPAGPR